MARPPWSGMDSSEQFTVDLEQDSTRRLLRLGGVVSEGAIRHLESAVVDLRDRELVIDLSEISAVDDGFRRAIAELGERVGRTHLHIRWPETP